MHYLFKMLTTQISGCQRLAVIHRVRSLLLHYTLIKSAILLVVG